MTWREVCAWLNYIGIHVSRSPPTLLRTLKNGIVYQELVRRISVGFWVRQKVRTLIEPAAVYSMLQHFFETDLVMHTLGCQRLDVAALAAGKAIEHLELLSALRTVLEAAEEATLLVAWNGVERQHAGAAETFWD